MRISVIETLNNSYALLHDDGLAVYDTVKQCFDKHNPSEIDIDFSGIKRCSTLFLNASFGKLLADYGEELVKKYILPSNYSEISSFQQKYSDVWDNFANKDNYQAYRDLEFA